MWYVILWYRFSQITKSHITNHKITITKSQITITKFVIVILWDLWFCDFVFTRIPNLFSCICPLFILWFRSQNLWLWLCDFVIRDLWFYDILDHKITNHESQKIVIINLWFCDCFFLCKKNSYKFSNFFQKISEFFVESAIFGLLLYYFWPSSVKNRDQDRPSLLTQSYCQSTPVC